MIWQRTLKTPVSTTGVGLHSGRKVNLTLRPADEDAGIVFRRIDLPVPVELPADPFSVCDTRMCSGLQQGEIKVGTVEHLMSALAGLGVDNVVVEVDAPEMPILDGSAAPFVYLIGEGGLVEQRAPRRYLRIRQPVRYEEGDKWVSIEPHDGFRLSFEIVFDHPAIARSACVCDVDLGRESYALAVARARTFGFVQDVEFMRASGLALGGSLYNAIVMDEYQVLNGDGLRYPDEFVRHKILDAIGDLYLAGRPLLGHYRAYKAGHALNNQLLRAILGDARSHELVSIEQGAEAPPSSPAGSSTLAFVPV